MAQTLTPPQIRRRKRIAADLGVTSAAIGLGTLAARGGQGVLRRIGKPGTIKAAEHIANHTQTALIIGTGVGSAGAINGAAINRAESRQRRRAKESFGKALEGKMGHVKGIGRVRVMYQHSPNHFMVLDKSDTKRLVHRNQMTFVKPSKKEQLGKGADMTTSAFGVNHNIEKANTAAFKAGKFVATGMKSVKSTTAATQKVAGEAGKNFGAGFTRKPDSLRPAGAMTRQTATMPKVAMAGNVTRKIGLPAAVAGTSFAVGSHAGKRSVAKSVSSKHAEHIKDGKKYCADCPVCSKVAKYSTGTITYHHEQAQMHARKKTSGKRQIAGGLATASAGGALHAYRRDVGMGIARVAMNNPGPASTKVGTAALRASGHVVSHGGKVLIGTGAGLAATGATRAVYHARQQNKQTKLAQQARKSRNSSLAKSYGYDSELKRHNRSSIATGASIAGGTGLIAAGAYQAKKAKPHIKTFTSPSNAKLNPGKLASVKIGRKGLEHGGKAAVLTAGGGALVMTGAKIHRKHSAGNWRSY